jgi:Josephin
MLQGPYWTDADLADIAHELDARERELMLSQGLDTDDAVRFIAEDSGNVDESGNFSFDVRLSNAGVG